MGNQPSTSEKSFFKGDVDIKLVKKDDIKTQTVKQELLEKFHNYLINDEKNINKKLCINTIQLSFILSFTLKILHMLQNENNEEIEKLEEIEINKYNKHIFSMITENKLEELINDYMIYSSNTVYYRPIDMIVFCHTKEINYDMANYFYNILNSYVKMLKTQKKKKNYYSIMEFKHKENQYVSLVHSCETLKKIYN